MSWHTSVGGIAPEVAQSIAETANNLAKHGAGAQPAVLAAIAAIAHAIAEHNPGQLVIFESSGHLDGDSGYGKLEFRVLRCPQCSPTSTS